MLKVITVSTEELENPETAFREIEDGIREGGGLLGHSAGIVACSLDYADAGFLEALSGRLEFPFVGTTSCLVSTDGAVGSARLSMMILTSDKVRFRAGMTGPLGPPGGDGKDDGEARRRVDGCFRKLYRELADGFSAPPSLVMPFLPMLPGHSDREVGGLLFEACEGSWAFGAKAGEVGNPKRPRTPLVFFRGEASDDRAALLVAEDGLNPRFFSAELMGESINRRKAIVTRSRGNVLYEVNDRPAEELLANLGLEGGNLQVTLNTTPVVLIQGDQQGHAPRVFVDRTPDGGLLFNGAMPEGTGLGLAVLEPEAIVETARLLFTRVAAEPDLKGAVFFSCLSRLLNLGWDEMKELKLLESAWEGSTAPPWLFAYTAGELCPRALPDGGLENAYMHFTVTAMAL